MRIRQLLSTCFLGIGLVFLLISGLLLAQNANAERTASEESAAALAALLTQTGSTAPVTDATANAAVTDDATAQTATASVNDAIYCGVLNLPSLGLTLPIQADFSYPNLKSSPCIYTREGNEALVMAAHNYTAHFGTLPQLAPKDTITYTTLDGVIHAYYVTEMRTIEETDLAAIEGSAQELILFTCNIHDNTQRVMVRCAMVQAEDEATT